MNASTKHIAKLAARLHADRPLAILLTASLRAANEAAESSLNPDLYRVLAWPENVLDYLEYLDDFAHWVPKQSTDPTWTAPGTDEQQEVYDRLCHFYWLIDQPVGPNKKVVEEDAWFASWLVGYAKMWGCFLDTTGSFDEEVLESFAKNSPKYRVEDSMVDGRPNAPSGWLTFNQFFARELNPGLRPIANPTDNAVVVSPADCTYRNLFAIGPDSTIPGITIKKTHRFAEIGTLLDGSPYGDAFAGGTCVHYFLGPYSYHHFHAPVAGRLLESRAVHGLVYLEVSLNNGQFDAPDSAQGGYEFGQARGIVILDTSESEFGDVGLVAVVPVGMCQVSSVNVTASVGSDLLKGDEFGYFLFGGSDIIVLFQEGARPQVDTRSQYRHYGTPIARCRQASRPLSER